jgi:hypothetical protein
MANAYRPPERGSPGFSCPKCGVLAQHTWFESNPGTWGRANVPYSGVMLSTCGVCAGHTYWVGDLMVLPTSSGAPLPNPDLSDDVRADFEEAGTILSLSPRGAAALLRLCVQKLCAELLGVEVTNLDGAIGRLVAERNLDQRVRQALDIVRVIGNNAVHPGQIDLRDDRATAVELFDLVNLVAEEMITRPRHIEALFDNLPAGAREAIERRDRPPS